MKLTTEQIERAKCVNLPSFLMAHGFELRKAGREYVLKEHDSLNIKDNAPGEHGKWYRFSTDEGGDNIDFVREFMGKSFVEAVELLNGESYVRDYTPSYSYERPKEIKTAEVVINENYDVRRTVDYLCLARKLDLDIVSKLISEGKIAQESGTDNVVFKVYDENNRLVGAEKVGTSTGHKFKGITEGSASGYGFEIVRGSGEKAMFFESAIDMLSYLQMYFPDNCRLVSMMGVKPSIVIDTVKRWGISPENIYICSDNDDAGNKFAQNMVDIFPLLKRIVPDERFKDWNDELRKIPKIKEEVNKVITYGNKTWNDATDNRDKSLVSMSEDTFKKLKFDLDASGINYFAYAKEGKAVMAVNDKDLGWLKQIAGNEDLPTRKSDVTHIPPSKNIIGNAEYRYIPDKQFISSDSDTALKMAEIMLSRNIQFSGRIYPNGKATLTLSDADLEHVKAIQQSVIDMRKQFSKETKADEIIGNKAYRDIRQRQFFYSKLTPEQYKAVQPYLDTNAEYSGLIRDNKVIFTVERDDSAAFHRALENAQREVGIINALKENGIDSYRLEKLSAVIHRFAVEDIHESLDNFFSGQLTEQQFDKMLALVNDYLAQAVSERYGEHSALNAMLDFKNDLDRNAEIEDFYSEHDFSDEQKAVIAEMFAKDLSKANVEVIDETFTPDEIREYYDILHNQLDSGDVAEFLEQRKSAPEISELTFDPVGQKSEDSLTSELTELTNKEKAFLSGDIVPFMAKAVLSWDETESIGYRFYEDGYIDKYAPHENSLFGNGLSDVKLHDLAHRMQDGEDIRKELSKALLGDQHTFITSHNNEFTVEYGEDDVTARYGNAERHIKYEDLGDAFFKLIKDEYDDIVHGRTVEELKYIFPDITEETADELINAFDGAVMHGWQENEVIQRRIKNALHDILGDDENTEKAFASIADMKYNFKVEAKQAELSPELNMAALEKWVAHRIQNDIIEFDDYHEQFASLRDVKADEILSRVNAEVVSKVIGTYETVDFNSAWDTLGSDDSSDEIDDFITSCVTESFENVLLENREQSPIHFGLLGNGVTVYDISRTDPETHDYVTVAHISAEGVVKVYDDSISAEDMAKINDEVRSVREEFMAEWDSLDTMTQYARLYNRADAETMLNIGRETISTEAKIAKYMPFVFFGEGERPQPKMAEKQRDPAVESIDFIGDRNGFEAVKNATHVSSFGTIIADGDTLTVVIKDNADVKDVRHLVETAQDNGVYLNKPSAKLLESRFGADFMQETPKPTVADLSVGDVILYDGKRREVENISEKSIMLKDVDSPDFGGVLLGTSDVLAYDDWQDDMNAKGFEIISKAENAAEIDERDEELAKSETTMDKSINFINNFCAEEYSVEANFSDLSHVDLVYTTDAETEYDIQVYANLEKFCMVTEYNGKIVREEQYDSLESMVDQALSNLDFNELAYLTDEERAAGEKSVIEHQDNTDMGPVTIRISGDFCEMRDDNAQIAEDVLGLAAIDGVVRFSVSEKSEYAEKLSNAGYFVMNEEVFELNPPKSEITPDTDIDKPLFTDADVIAEIEKSENSSDKKPFWSEPTVEGEQLSMFGDLEPVVNKPKKSAPKEEYQQTIYVGDVNRFAALRDEVMRGSGFEDGKFRIEQFYKEKKPTNKEFADFLKNEYGTGGHTGDDKIFSVDHDSQGMFFTLRTGEKFKFSWNEVAQEIATRIDCGEYITQEDIDRRISHAKFTVENTSPDSALEFDRIQLEQAHKVLQEYGIEKADEPINDDKPATIEVGDKFRNKKTGEISEVISLSGALAWYTDDCTVRRESGGFAIEENVPYAKLFNNDLYEYLGRVEPDAPVHSEWFVKLSHHAENSDVGAIGRIIDTSKESDGITNMEFCSGIYASKHEYGIDLDFARRVAQELNDKGITDINDAKAYVNAAVEKHNQERLENPDISEISTGIFTITDDSLGNGGAKAKFRANMDAINLLHELEFDKRPATDAEKEVLSKYVGWGSLAKAFEERNKEWSDEFIELYMTLSPEEYRQARSSVLDAFYTSPTIINSIYDALENFGFAGGSVLEPAMGIGNFFGCMPERMRANSDLYGVEIDSISGRIAQKLYPDADIAIKGFEHNTFQNGCFDVAVGNVPFGDLGFTDNKHKTSKLHDYFFAETLDNVSVNYG